MLTQDTKFETNLGHLNWLMVFYAENLSWINSKTEKKCGHPFHGEDQKKKNQTVAFYLTMIENGYAHLLDKNSKAYVKAQALFNELHGGGEYHHANIAHAISM